MSCTGLHDEARVSVDTALLDRAAFEAPILAVALIAGLIGLGLAVRAAPAGHRAWSFVTVLAPLGALLTWTLFQVRTELAFECVRQPALHSTRLIALSAGIASLSFLQLCVTLTLRAWKRELSVLWPTVLLTTSLVIAGSVGAHKRGLQREFERRVNAVMPVPDVRQSTPPEAHVGRPVEFKPWIQAARRTEGFFIPSPVLMSDDDRRSWSIDTVTLTPEAEGLNVVPIHLARDLVSVDTALQVKGVRDEGPGWFPLAKGNRWEFIAVRGRGGVVEKLRSSLARGKKPIPAAALTFEVTGEGEREGFHFFEITETRQGGEPTVRELVRRDGELFSGYTRVAFPERGGCRVTLLEPSWCSCEVDRITHCTSVSGALGEGLLRLFLGAVTLGITELQGMGDLGAGNEAGMLLTRWKIDANTSALGPQK